MQIESNEIYSVYVDEKTKCPTLRINWKKEEDEFVKFINSLADFEKEKIYDFMRNEILDSSVTIKSFYDEYNNENGVKELKKLI